jgi:hypothetical protein
MANEYNQNNQFNNPMPEQGPPPNLPTEPVAPPMPEVPPMPEPPAMPNLNKINISKPEPQMTPPVMPSYNPPMPEILKKERSGNSSIIGMIVLIIAVIVIVSLAFLLYYYATRPSTAPQVQQQTAQPVVEKKPVAPVVNPTKIVMFTVPDDLPATTQIIASCVASVAEPYREDSYKCTVGKKIYDPCFSVGKNNLLYCQLDPTVDDANVFLVQNNKALPKITVTNAGTGNWGWFIKLRDGTFCSPFTGSNFSGAKPIVNGKAAIYGCRSAVATEQVLIIGNLTKGEVWKAQKSVVTKSGTVLVEKSTKLVEVDTVWQ